MTRVVIGLGSNAGDRRENLERALGALDGLSEFRLGKVSSVYGTDPVGDTTAPDFMNAAAEGFTTLTPQDLLDALHHLERASGRGDSNRAGARTLDLDLVFFGDRVLTGARLTVPHPRYAYRAFVLVPLAEVAPDWVDPVTSLSIREQLARFPDTSGVRWLGPLRIHVS